MAFAQWVAARQANKEWRRLERRIGLSIDPRRRIDYLYCSRLPVNPLDRSPAIRGMAYLTVDGMLLVPEPRHGEPRLFVPEDFEQIEVRGKMITFFVNERDTINPTWSFSVMSHQPELLTHRFIEAVHLLRATRIEVLTEQES